MQEFEELMGELIELGISANPVCPFACCVIDPCGQILVTAACAMHISPLFSAEGLAIHMLAGNYYCKPEQKLTLVTNAEPEFGGMSAVLWARCCTNINISRIIYGARAQKISEIWDCGFCFSGNEMVQKIPEECRPEVIGPTIEDDCLESFSEGKALEAEEESPVLSLDLDDFWMAGDWLLDMDE